MDYARCIKSRLCLLAQATQCEGGAERAQPWAVADVA